MIGIEITYKCPKCRHTKEFVAKDDSGEIWEWVAPPKSFLSRFSDGVWVDQTEPPVCHRCDEFMEEQ